MSKPVENFYKSLVEPNRGYTWKQDLNRLREMLPMTVFLLFELGRELMED